MTDDLSSSEKFSVTHGTECRTMKRHQMIIVGKYLIAYVLLNVSANTVDISLRRPWDTALPRM